MKASAPNINYEKTAKVVIKFTSGAYLVLLAYASAYDYVSSHLTGVPDYTPKVIVAVFVTALALATGLNCATKKKK